jgi:FAD/FMN-containing dehydrogenase
MPDDNLDHASSIAAAHRALRLRLPAGQVHVSGSGYADGVALWNGAVKHRPAVLLSCTSTDDVVVGVRTAREFGLPLSVRSRGHDYAGRALVDGGLTLDLRPMHSVRVDPEARIAEVGGGASANHLLAAADEHGLVAATGTIGAVGVAGLTLGGGYGPLAGRVGLAADNLLAAELVTADGSVVRTDARRDPDLLWALRGGGGNFGVVTSMTVRLHAVPAVVTGMVLYPWKQAGQVLERVREAQQDGPDDLTIQVGAIIAPDGSPALLVLPTWSGDVATGMDASGPVLALGRLGDPLLAQLDAASYAATVAGRDAMFPDGRHVTIRTRDLSAPLPRRRRQDRPDRHRVRPAQAAPDGRGHRGLAGRRRRRERSPLGRCGIGGAGSPCLPGRVRQPPRAGRSRPDSSCLRRQSATPTADQSSGGSGGSLLGNAVAPGRTGLTGPVAGYPTRQWGDRARHLTRVFAETAPSRLSG